MKTGICYACHITLSSYLPFPAPPLLLSQDNRNLLSSTHSSKRSSKKKYGAPAKVFVCVCVCVFVKWLQSQETNGVWSQGL